MKNYKKPLRAFLLSLMFVSFANQEKLEAGFITINNNSKSALKINVILASKGIPYCAKCLGSSQRECQKETTKIMISLGSLCGDEYVSIIDVTNGFMVGGQCKNLNVSKNYDVSFVETALGTRCQYKEI